MPPNFSFSVNNSIVAKQANDEAYPPSGSRDDIIEMYKRKSQRKYEINYYTVRLQVGSNSGIKQLKKVHNAGLGCYQSICGSGNNCGAYCNTSDLAPYCALSWGANDSGWTGDIAGSSCGNQYVVCVQTCGLQSCTGCNC
jgi:hypothetical protein